MKRKRFTEEQIIGILRENEAGAKAADLARKHGISEGTFYNWKAKFGGMDVSDAKRLRSLEDENAKLKRLLIVGTRHGLSAADDGCGRSLRRDDDFARAAEAVNCELRVQRAGTNGRPAPRL